MIMLTGIMNGQSFDFDCPWLPLFETQISNFPQSNTYTVRYVEVTKTGGEVTIVTLNEYIEQEDLNGDSDYFDILTYHDVTEATYTASFNLGYHIVPEIKNELTILNHSSLEDLYNYELDNRSYGPDASNFDREDYEKELRDLGNVTVVFSHLYDYYGNELSTNYHTITVGEWNWDNINNTDTIHSMTQESWNTLYLIVQRELLKVKYDQPQTTP